MDNDLKKERQTILKLLLRCPFQIALSDCPAKDIRKLSSIKKFTIVRKMTKQELDRILGYHENCSKERVNSG